MIRLRGVHKTYGARDSATKVLAGVDLDIDKGEFVAIVGRSGTGKTTLLNIIGGLDSDYTGEVQVDGIELHRLGDTQLAEYRNRKVGFVFQSFHLLDHLDCVQNAALPALFSRSSTRSMAEIEARAREVLTRVGLDDKFDAYPPRLSGGQRQRVAIARALFNEPSVLVCDEPTGNLDHETGAHILDIFRSLVSDHGVTLIIVTHDDIVSSAAQRVIELHDGKIRERGSVETDSSTAAPSERVAPPPPSGTATGSDGRPPDAPSWVSDAPEQEARV